MIQVSLWYAMEPLTIFTTTTTQTGELYSYWVNGTQNGCPTQTERVCCPAGRLCCSNWPNVLLKLRDLFLFQDNKAYNLLLNSVFGNRDLVGFMYTVYM
jgi:hypothetical protein